MHILVVNDDGPPSNNSSPYVHSLVSTYQAAGHVVSVVLPHVQRSWIGKAHIVGATVRPTYFRPGTLHKDDGTTHNRPLPPGSDGEEWILVDGTPASCVQIGLHHCFKDRGPVDLVVSGPNYGRNTTAVFSLSSGTIGGAMEAAVCQKKAIALSYAFFDRIHDPEIIHSASKLSVKLTEHLFANWDASVDVYSVNVPLVKSVETNKILYTDILQNYWSSGSCFEEIEPVEEDQDPAAHEEEIRREEKLFDSAATDASDSSGHKATVPSNHKHYKWAPNFADVHKSVMSSKPGNDGWAVREGHTSVTPLKANFWHVAGPKGELKLSPRPAALYALIDYEDAYVQPLILSALARHLDAPDYKLIDDISELPSASATILQFRAYESIAFDHLHAHPASSVANAYMIRKALIRKHYLAHTVHVWQTKHPDSPLRHHVKPALDFELDYAEFLDDALLEAYELHDSFRRNAQKISFSEREGEAEAEGEDEDEAPTRREWWILKPGMADRGQGVRLFSSEEELRRIFEEWEPDSSDDDDDDGAAAAADDDDNDVDDENVKEDAASAIMTSHLRHFVVQPYIDPPLLVVPPPSSTTAPNDGREGRDGVPRPHKFHIRAYVLALSSLRVYVHRELLALFASEPYVPPSADADLSAHLTNTCLQPRRSTGMLKDEMENEERERRNSRDQTATKTQTVHSLDSLPLSAELHASIVTQIHTVTGALFEAAAGAASVHFQPRSNAFELFGVDFLVDVDGVAWLLEVNAFPDFAQTGDVLRDRVIGALFEDVVGLVLWEFFGLESVNAGSRQSGLIKVLDLDLGRR
ncbi:MAG: hypothetical protein M1825_004039 [Sarcosagium campestre]|nr:MAG: hypothetical protein M1825_004039 [Sarcosagium campestre]